MKCLNTDMLIKILSEISHNMRDMAKHLTHIANPGRKISDLPEYSEQKRLKTGIGTFLSITGIMFLAIAAICFVAWNWRNMSHALKFTLDAALFISCIIISRISESFSKSMMFCACICIGLFWAIFGQVYQSGSGFEDFCAAWAISMIPLLAIRNFPLIWNLWYILIVLAFAGHGETPAIPLLASVAFLLLTVFIIKKFGNGWIVPSFLATTILATACCIQTVFAPQVLASDPCVLSGPVVLAGLAMLAIKKHQNFFACCLSVSGFVILNSIIFKIFEVLIKNGISEDACIGAGVLLNLAFAWLAVRKTGFKMAGKIASGLGGMLSAVLLAVFMTMIAGYGWGLFPCSILCVGTGIAVSICRQGPFYTIFAVSMAFSGVLTFDAWLCFMSAGAATLSACQLLVIPAFFMFGKSIRIMAITYAVTAIFCFCILSPGDNSLIMNITATFCLFPILSGNENKGKNSGWIAIVFSLFLFMPVFTNLADEKFIAFHSQMSEPFLSAACFIILIAVMAKKAASNTGLLLSSMFLAGISAVFLPSAALLAGCVVMKGFSEQKTNRFLVISGYIMFALSMLAFYYGLETSFLKKTGFMGIQGLFFLSAGLATLKILKGAGSIFPQVRYSQIWNVKICLAFFLVITGCLIAVANRQNILSNGEIVIFKMAPVDPRAFMLGDYMNLAYEIDRKIPELPSEDGYVPFETDNSGTVTKLIWNEFGKISDMNSGNYIKIKEGMPFLPRRFYFEEGTVSDKAGYVAMRCLNGECLAEKLMENLN